MKRAQKKKKGTKKTYKNKSKTINKMEMRTHISVITLNVNGLNAPIKRHRVAEWIQKQDPYIYAAYKRLTSDLKTDID